MGKVVSLQLLRKKVRKEHQRIQDKIVQEENPIHRKHLVFIKQMIDDKLRVAVPAIEKQKKQEEQKINFQTYFNGKLARESNIVRGIQKLVADGFKHMRWSR